MPKVIFLNMSGRCLEIDSETESVCILPISVGQPYHEGKAFEAVIRAANGANFTKIVIVIADTLQRYTFQLKGMSEADALRVSKEKGKAWVKGILKYLSNLETPIEKLGVNEVPLPEDATTYPPPVTLRLPCKIVYWDELLTDVGFAAEKKFVDETYEKSKKGTVGALRGVALAGKKKLQTFFTTIEDVGCGFLSAYLSAHENDPGFNLEEAEVREQAGHFFLNYVLEELAVTLLYGNLDPIRKKYIAYPHVVKACEAITELFVDLFHDRDRENLRFINIHFNGIDFVSQRRKSLKPPKSMLESQVTPVTDDDVKGELESTLTMSPCRRDVSTAEKPIIMPRSVQILTLEGKPLKLYGSYSKKGVCPISDTAYFKGEAFAAIVEALNKSDFEEIIIVVRGKSSYTLQIDGTSEEDAKVLARKSELEWLESVAKYLPDLAAHVRLNPGEQLNISVSDVSPLTQLTKPYQVKLWEEVLESPCFAEAKVKLDTRYKREESLSTSPLTHPLSKEARSALSKKLEFYKIIYGAAEDVYSAYLTNHMSTLTIDQIKQAEKDGYGHALCVRHLLTERSADFVLVEYGVYFLYSFDYGTDNVRKMPKLIKRILKEDGGKDVIPVNLNLVDFPEISQAKRPTKPPLAIQVTPPADNSEDEPKSKKHDEKSEITEERLKRGSRGRSASAPKRVEGLSAASVPISISRRSSDLERFAEERRESPEEFGRMLERYLKDPEYGREYFSALLMAAAKYSSILTELMPQCAPLAKPPVALTVSPPKEPPRDLSGPTLRKTKSAGPESSFFRHGERVAKSEEVSESTAQKVR